MYLHEKRINTEYCPKPVSFRKQLKAAAQANAKYAIIFVEEDAKVDCAKIKNMLSGDEEVIEIDQLIEALS
jgi:histidyl-tRNA synthetase